MVTGRRNPRRGGVSALGCLFAIAVIIAVLYYGIDIGRVYWNYYSLRDEMEQSARFGSSQTDAQILRILTDKAKDLGLPEEARQFVVTRSTDPNRIRIRTHYTVEVVLPFKHKVFDLHPDVEVRQ
jgi:hypothetical protein